MKKFKVRLNKKYLLGRTHNRMSSFSIKTKIHYESCRKLFSHKNNKSKTLSFEQLNKIVNELKIKDFNLIFILEEETE